MNKNFAWELFKNTGNIDAFLLMKDMEYGNQMIETQNEVQNVLGESNGINKNQGDSNQSS